MGCCGQKRQTLNFRRPEKNEIQIEDDVVPHAQSGNANAVDFRYTGNGMLEINGFLNRRKYRFSPQTPVISVSPEDVSIVRGYEGVAEIK